MSTCPPLSRSPIDDPETPPRLCERRSVRRPGRAGMSAYPISALAARHRHRSPPIPSGLLTARRRQRVLITGGLLFVSLLCRRSSAIWNTAVPRQSGNRGGAACSHHHPIHPRYATLLRLPWCRSLRRSAVPLPPPPSPHRPASITSRTGKSGAFAVFYEEPYPRFCSHLPHTSLFLHVHVQMPRPSPPPCPLPLLDVPSPVCMSRLSYLSG